MKNVMHLKNGLISAIALSLFFSVSFADASGSYGGSVRTIDSKKEAQYHKGKSVLRKKLLCSGCPLDGKKVKKSTAPEILQQLQSGDFSNVLKSGDKQALTTYLSRRYRLK